MRKDTELGTKPVMRLLWQYALPAITATVASSLLNIVDRIFIGQFCGPMAISGLAVTLPLVNLTIAFGSMVGVGSSTIISIRLGQRDLPAARRVLGNALGVNLLIGVLIGGLSLLFIDPILYAFGASANTITYAREYMVVMLLGNVVSHTYFGLNANLRAVGHPRTAMSITLLCIVTNAFLDPLFMYVFRWGIRGAAIATILSQMIPLVWQLRIFMDRTETVHIRSINLDAGIVRSMLGIGMSPFLMHLALCTVTVFINNGLLHYGSDLAVGAYGIANTLTFFFCMVVLGLVQGMQPIVGYNYGARNYDRVMETLKYAIVMATVVTTTAFLIAMVCPRLAVMPFSTDAQLVDMAARGFRYMVLVFPVVGFQMVTTNFFQSIGMARKSIFLSLTRQLLFLLPGLLLLPLAFGVDGIWMSMPLSDVLATVTSAIFLARQIHEFSAG